jgi:hypothetical protein
LLKSGRFGKIDNELTQENISMNGNSSGYGFGGLKSAIGYGQNNPNNNNNNRLDDKNMMEVILKNSANDGKQANGHYGSNSNLATTGGLPGVRGRTRQSISGSKIFKIHGRKNPI